LTDIFVKTYMLFMRAVPLRPPRRASVAVDKVNKVDKLLGVLADRTRLRLLNLMGGQEICVCYLVEVLRISQPKISRHLARLRKAGMVSARREGKWMHYRISDEGSPSVLRLLEQLKPLFAEDAEMRLDRQRLGQACCAPGKFVHLRRAPVPTLLRDEAGRGSAAVTRKTGK